MVQQPFTVTSGTTVNDVIVTLNEVVQVQSIIQFQVQL